MSLYERLKGYITPETKEEDFNEYMGKYAMKPGGIIPTYDLNAMQAEYNAYKNMITDNTNMAINPPYTTTTNTTGSQVQYVKYVPSVKEVTSQEKEEAETIAYKKWAWAAKKFAENFPKWRVVPDVNDPLRKIRVMHESNQMWIQNCWPNNEVRIVGADKQICVGKGDKYDPLEQIGLEFPVHSMHIFERWAFGYEECPYGK